MVRQFRKNNSALSVVLVTSIYGHKDMLDYFSDFRTQDKAHGKHYYPRGALCWFEANQYGDPTGSVYFERKIPDEKMLELPMTERGFRRLKAQKASAKNFKHVLLKEKYDTEEKETIKPKLHKWKEGE